MRRFDLDLFRELQEEYRERPIVPAARQLDGASLEEAARRRVRRLIRRLGSLDGARVLEIGCGAGHVSRVLADEHGCDTVGVDVFESEAWAERPDLRFHDHDISVGDNGPLGRFDLIVSFTVWEHVEHPYAALRASREMLEPSGRKYLNANLYRGPKASHLYREIYFPWPHLLFSDEVIADYYRQDLGVEMPGAAWVNKLTAAHYLTYFDRLDLCPQQVWWSGQPVDEPFFERFSDVLGRYPRFDLERDFIHTVLTRGAPGERSSVGREIEETRARIARLARQRDRARLRAREIETSRSWRLTAPLRRARSTGGGS